LTAEIPPNLHAKNGRNRQRIALFSVLSFLILECVAGSTLSLASETVRLQLKWFHQFQFAGYYAAQALGFYRDEGLEVEIIEGAIDRSPDKTVLEGKAEFGVHDGGELVYLRLRGAPVVAIAAIFQHSPYVIISRQFHQPANLVGLTIPITQDQGSAQILAMLRHEGIKVQSVFDREPVHFVPHTWSFTPFIEGRVQATAAYITEMPRFRRIYGFEPAVMNPLDYGVDFYGDTLFTSEAYLNAKPRVVERFRRASLRGWEYAMAHPAEIARMIEDIPSYRHPKPERQDLMDEARAMQSLILPNLVELGNMNPGRWEKMAHEYSTLGMVPALTDLENFMYSADAEKLKIRRTLKILGGVLAAVSLLALLSLTWISILRAQVRMRTQELASDIARRQKAEVQVQAAKQLLDSIVENVPNMIFLKRASDLRFELFNKAGEALLGLKREQLIGKNDYDLFPQAEAEFFTSKDLYALAQTGIVDIPEERISTAGGPRILHTQKVPLHDEQGNPQYLLGISEDITERMLAENRLRESEAKLRGLFELSNLGIALTDLQGRYIEFNRAFQDICGYSREELATLDYWELTPIEYAPQEARQLECLTAKGSYGPYEKEYIRKDGKRVPLQLNGVLIHGADGKDYIWSIVEDISERKLNEARLHLTARVFDSTMEGILLTDSELNIVEVNQAFCSITGYGRDDVLGKKPNILKSGCHSEDFYARMWASIHAGGHWTGELWNRKKDGELYPGILTISAVKDELGELLSYVGVFTDITPLKHHEKQLQHAAHYDALTGIPNRVLLAERMNHALALAIRNHTLLAVCYLDLDGFKPINDSFGHEIGDQILIEVARRIQDEIRSDDTVARLGGDEFVILLSGIRHAEECSQALERLLGAVSQPINIGGRSFGISTSIGVSLYPGDSENTDSLLRHADQAMYVAKQSGKNRYHLYDPEQDKRVRAQQILLEQIALGLDQDQFELYYQPKLNLRSRKLIGAEALIRWRHPERGMIPPGEFLKALEDTELEIRLGEWVINSAIDQLDKWSRTGRDLELSINISAFHLQSKGFVDKLKHSLMARFNGTPCRLQIEILETAALEDMQKVTDIIEECRAFGVSFALDDFGTGYSSLSYLSNLPVNTLKIDQSFVRDMLADQSDRAIVQGVIALAKAFGRETVAEGIENRQIYQLLVDMGCELGQGYGIARPMPAKDFSVWIFDEANSSSNCPVH